MDRPLEERMREAQAQWRRPLADTLLTAAGLALSVAILLVGLALAWQRGSEGPVWVDRLLGALGVSAAIAGESQCAALPAPRRDGRLVLIAAGTEGDARIQTIAFREALASYFRTEVELLPAGSAVADRLDGADGLVILANGRFEDEGALDDMLAAANRRGLPFGWIGPGGAAHGDALGLAFATEAASRDNPVIVLGYNGALIPVEGQPFDPVARPMTQGQDDIETLALASRRNGDTFTAIARNGTRIYAGFLPFRQRSGNLSLPAVIDALSLVFGRHARDPRVIFRIEDISSTAYGPGDTAFRTTTDILLSEGVFMHLGIIPEAVDEDQSLREERVLSDIGSAHDLVRLVRAHPDAVEIVQHGYRHSRRDARNEGCLGTGCAFEFFADDDVTMGAEAAAAFAAERLDAGRDLLERHLGKPYVYEAPHYLMSPAETRVARQRYPLFLYSVIYHDDVATSFYLPWFTERDGMYQGPAEAGYVSIDDPESVARILGQLDDTARVLPDPLVVVFFHPYMSQVEGRQDDLKRLIAGIRGLGYRFASACGELAAR